jgi:hypothetical protein
MERTTYKVGLSPDELNMFPLSYERDLTTLEEVYDHCKFIAQQLAAKMPLGRKGFLEGVEAQDKRGSAFVTLDFSEPEIKRAIAIIFKRERKAQRQKTKQRPKRVRPA